MYVCMYVFHCMRLHAISHKQSTEGSRSERTVIVALCKSLNRIIIYNDRTMKNIHSVFTTFKTFLSNVYMYVCIYNSS